MTWNDIAHAALGILDVPVIARDQMQMGMPDGLPACEFAIGTEIEALGRVLLDKEVAYFTCQRKAGCVFFGGGVEDRAYVALGDDAVSATPHDW